MSIETLNSYVCVPRIIDFELSENKLYYKSITTIAADSITHVPILKTEYDELIKQTTNLKKQIKKLKQNNFQLKRRNKSSKIDERNREN